MNKSNVEISRGFFQKTKHSKPFFTISIFLSFSSTNVKRFSQSFTTISSKTNSLTPNFKFLLSDHLKNQRLDEALEVLNKIRFPGVHLYTMMIDGYTRNHRLDDAIELFGKMRVRDTVSWNSMIKGCLHCGDLVTAKKLFDEMPGRNVVSWTTMVNGYLQFGKIEVSERLFFEMPVKDIAAWNSMIYGYLKFGRVDEALSLFRKMPSRNVISWTSMIDGLDYNGRTDEALILFKKMGGSGVELSSNTLSCVLTACANVMALHLGVQTHGQIVKLGFCFDEFICASLLTFYANCKQMENACKVFNEKLHGNVVIWTALLTGYGLNHRHESALMVFGDMIRMAVLPNQSSFTSALNSCSGLEALDRGEGIHAVAIKLGLASDAFVAWSRHVGSDTL